MNDTDTQAVVDETNAAPVADAEVTNAREGDDLDTLLKEFDQGTKTVDQPKPEPKPGADSDEVVTARNEVLQARDEIRQEKFTKDMRATVDDIRGDLPKEHFDDTLVRGWINARAEDDPRLAKAWMERAAKPQEFKRVVASLGREFAKKYGRLPDKQATEDREAVTAAVRGASTKVPEGKSPDFTKMSDGEFGKEVQEKYGFRPF